MPIDLTDARQFCYINAAFSPAPDDTVANLYKVRQSSWAMSAQLNALFCIVLWNRRLPHRELQLDSSLGLKQSLYVLRALHLLLHRCCIPWQKARFDTCRCTMLRGHYKWLLLLLWLSASLLGFSAILPSLYRSKAASMS